MCFQVGRTTNCTAGFLDANDVAAITAPIGEWNSSSHIQLSPCLFIRRACSRRHRSVSLLTGDVHSCVPRSVAASVAAVQTATTTQLDTLEKRVNDGVKTKADVTDMISRFASMQVKHVPSGTWSLA